MVWAEHFKNSSKCKRQKQKRKRKAKSKALAVAVMGTQQLRALDDSVVGQQGGMVEEICEEEEEEESYGEENTGGFISCMHGCTATASRCLNSNIHCMTTRTSYST